MAKHRSVRRWFKPGFDDDDPLKDLHVSRWRRKRSDGGKASDASEGGVDGFDRTEVRSRGGVVPAEDLQ